MNIKSITGNLDTFYDRHLRLWTAMLKDAEGNQICVAGHGPTQELAIDDINYSDCAHLSTKQIDQRI